MARNNGRKMPQSGSGAQRIRQNRNPQQPVSRQQRQAQRNQQPYALNPQQPAYSQQHGSQRQFTGQQPHTGQPGEGGQVFRRVSGPSANRNGLTAQQRKIRQQRQRELKRRRRQRRRLAILLILLILAGIGFLAYRMLSGGGADEQEQVVDSAFVDADQYIGEKVANILFVGDISVSNAQLAAAQSGYDFDFSAVFSDVAGHIAEADYAVGNFEATIVDDLNYGGDPYYNAPPVLASSLKALGFHLMSTANTYMLNNGIDGLTATKSRLEEAGLRTVGTYLSQEERDKNGGAYMCSIKGIKFAFLAYTKGTDSVTMPSGCEYALNTLYQDYSTYWTDLRSSQIRRDIQAAEDAGADVIIALVHWGSEYGKSITEAQETVKDLMLNNGVDVIIGTHSHIVNEMGFETVTNSEGVKRECFVAYGLGDFYTDPEQELGRTSLMLNLTFEKGDNGEVRITNASYVPTYLNISDEGGHTVYEVRELYKMLAKLARKSDITSTDARQINALLSAIDTLHDFAPETLDVGLDDADARVVNETIESGGYSETRIAEMEDEEQAAAEAAEAAEAAAREAEAAEDAAAEANQ